MKIDINRAVTGENFHGRTDELDYYRENLFGEVIKGNCRYYSITGMSRIGKTSLMKELCREYRQHPTANLYVIESDLEGKTSFWDYWIRGVIKKLDEQIDRNAIDENYRDTVSECLDYFANAATKEALYDNCSDRSDAEAKEQLEILLHALYYSGKSILLIMDGFDTAGKLFGRDGTKANFGWFRGLLQEDVRLSVVTLSRRSIYYIEYSAFGGSILSSVFSPRSLFGFTNSEINCFLDELSDELGGLDEQQKKEIWYSCGRSPDYLARMAQAMIEEKSLGKNSVTSIASGFCDSYTKIIRLLEEERLLTPMLQMFVGPVYNLQEANVDKLVSMGYCVRASFQDSSRSNEYADLFNPNLKAPYLTVCDHFIDYLHDTHQAELESIWPKLTKTMHLLRKMIEVEYAEENPDGWKDDLKAFIQSGLRNTGVQDGFMNEHQRLFNRAAEESQAQVGNSILNVIALSNLKFIISYSWDRNFCFEKYFKVSRARFNIYMDKLHNARNPIAHGNGSLLSPQEISDVEDICDNFTQSINEVLSS